jgi:hypothetical protein
MPKLRYRNWWIDYDPPPVPSRNCDWHFWHDDYDGAPTYGDEGPADNRCGSAPSLEAAKAEIDLWYDEEFECSRCREASPDSCLALVCPDRRPLEEPHA